MRVQPIACVVLKGEGEHTLALVAAACPVHNGALQDLAVIATYNQLLWLDVPVAVPSGVDGCQLLHATQSLYQRSAQKSAALTACLTPQSQASHTLIDTVLLIIRPWEVVDADVQQCLEGCCVLASMQQLSNTV